MKDEEFVFRSDSRDKAITARSARHTRTHCGKGGRVRLPSDNLTKKELQKMNGETKSYRLNEPVSWQEFKLWPDDIKVMYIKLLRQKFNVPGRRISEMMKVDAGMFAREVRRLGIAEPDRKPRTKWDKDGFCVWAYGVDMVPAPVPEEEPVEAPVEVPVIEEAPVHFCEEECEAVSDIGCESSYVEDDLPFEEPDLSQAEELTALRILIDELKKVNEELVAVHDKDKDEKECLRNECDRQRMQIQILEAQMDVVRLIFGGKNNG